MNAFSAAVPAPAIDDPQTWRTVAERFAEAGAYLPALAAIGRAHALDPGCLDDALKRGELAQLARTPEAELLRLGAVAAAHPGLGVPLAGQAALLHRLGRNAEAIELLEAACALEPQNCRLTGLLGAILARDMRFASAASALAEALKSDPDNHTLRHDYGVVLYRMLRFAQSRRELLAAAEGMGDDPVLLANLANSTLCLGMQDEALALADRGVAGGQNAMALRTRANVLPYIPGTTGAGLLAALRACDETLPRVPASMSFANRPDPGRRLRVGLLGGVLKTHPVGWLTVAGFENLDPAGFQLVGIADTVAGDPLSRRFRAVAAEWIEPAGKSEAQIADATRAAGIDLLIDLGGYGDFGRMPACSYRPAPVQVKWVGMQNHSTGMAAMDWFVTDGWETPPELAGNYSERLLVLPDGYVCYSPPSDAPDLTKLPMAEHGYPTFGAFCNIAKVNAGVLDAWCAVLRAVPGSRFILKSHPLSDPEIAARFREAFSARGITPERVEFRSGSPHRSFLAQWGDIDIALDTFPYSGGLTTVEALWMGVPTIALPGEIFAARHSLSHLSNAGLADWVAADVDDYVGLAARRIADPAALAALREGLRERVRRSPLCDAPRFGRNLGAALRFAWQEWCSRQ